MSKRIFALIAALVLISGLASGATLNVHWDGVSGDYATIQEAIDAAVSGDEIVVAQGIYRGEGNYGLDFGGKALVVRSTDSSDGVVVDTTVIDCEGQGRAFIFQNGEGLDSVVDGFTIKNGIDADYGGGIECDGASPTISNCVIRNCEARDGGAIDCYGGASPLITGCVIENNIAGDYGGAIACYVNSNPEIFGCIIRGNSAGRSGGGVECNLSAPKIISCEFMDNTAAIDGGAVSCFDGGSAVITNCLMVGNSAGQYGGAIDASDSNPVISYCTVVDNVGGANYGGIGGISADDLSALVSVTSCILQGNGANLSENLAISYLVTYSCIEGGHVEPTNIDVDPLFRTGDSGDYYLSQVVAGQRSNSICVNADTSGFVAEGFVPADYTTRTDNQVDDQAPDIGYHYASGDMPEMLQLTADIMPDPADPNVLHGSISVDGMNVGVPFVGEFVKYSEVFLYATPDIDGNGYVALGWEGVDYEVDDYSTNPRGLTVTLLTDRQVSVAFGPAQMRVLTVAVVGEPEDQHGTIVATTGAAIDGQPGESWQYANLTAIVQAYPDTGYQVRFWTGTIDDENNAGKDSAVVFMDFDKTVYVEFVSNATAHLDVIVLGGHGSVDPKRADVAAGIRVRLDALPDEGYRVVRWSGTEYDDSIEPNNVVEMLWSKTVTVEFEVEPVYMLYPEVYTIDGVIYGTIDPNAGPYYEGERVDLYATPDDGYEVYKWYYTEFDDSQEPNNIALMDATKRVFVQFREEALPIGSITLGDNTDPNFFYPTIQAAIDASNMAGNGEEVVVAEGVYTGDGNRNLNLLGGLADPAVPGPGITVRSELGALTCVIDCEGAGQGFIFAGTETSIHVVRGFTITNGEGGQGGAIYFGAGATPIVDDCRLINNHSTEGGGAVWFEGPPEDTGDGGDPDVEYAAPDFDLTGPEGIPDGINDSWDLNGDLMIDATNDATDLDGDGVPDVGNIDGVPTIEPEPEPEPVIEYAILTNSVIEGNVSNGNGGGVYVTNVATPWITNTIIRNNTSGDPSGVLGIPAAFGGGVYSDLESVPAFINCFVYGNEATEIGGAFYLFESDAVIRLCTIMYNTGLDYGDQVDGVRVGPKGGIAARDSDPEINHCIIGRNGLNVFGYGFWGDESTWGDDLYECEATYSCIENGDEGEGNIDTDPDPDVIQNNPLLIPGADPYGDVPFAPDTAYLMQVTAGQPVTSPCVDEGEQFALGDIQAAYLLGDNMTTSTNNDYDSGFCDIGFHYPRYDGPPSIPEPPEPYRKYYLYVVVINNGDGDNGYVEVLPESTVGYEKFDVIDLIAYPDAGYRVRSWLGSDDSPAWNSLTNTVTMDDDKVVFIEFEKDMQRHLLVPRIYLTIEDAVLSSSPGDIIIVDPGVHYLTDPNGINFQGKSVELRSTDPDNAGVIAETIIDCAGTRYITKRAFQFVSGEGPDTLVRGFTVRNGFYHGKLGIHGFYPGTPIDPREDPPVRFSADHGENVFGNGFGGAVICKNGSSPLFEHCVFADNTVTGGYGGDGDPGFTAFYNDNKDGQWAGWGGRGEGNGYGGVVACRSFSNPVFRYCVFTDNSALGGCGGDGGQGGDEHPDDGGNAGSGGWGADSSGVGIGGVVYADEGSAPLFESCEFTNNVARWGILGSGGFRGEGGDGDPVAYDAPRGDYWNFFFYPWGDIWDDIIFPGFQVDDTVAGGAAFFETSSNASFINSTFTGNSAFEVSTNFSFFNDARYDREFPNYTVGGAIYSRPGNRVTLVGCEFYDSLGGAVYCEGGNIVTITESRDDDGEINRKGLFKNNQSLEDVDYANTGFYGDYYYSFFFSGWYNYDDYFQGDNRVSPSGALFVGPGGYLNVRNTDFQNNVAYTGGAVNTKSDSNFDTCMFNGNKAGGYGGAVDAYINTEFDRVVINLHFDSCTFAGNSAIWGGAIHTHDFDASFIDSYMVGNTAQSGGAIFLSEGKANISGGSYRDNVVIDESPEGLDGIGGAVAAVTADIRVSNSEWIGNKAKGNKASGGAIAFYGGDDFTRQTVTNCLFVDNSATIKGGAVSCSIFTDPNIVNSTFCGNSAEVGGGAIGCDWMSSVEVANSIFDNCGEHAISEEDYNSSLLTNNLFNNNGSSDYGIYYIDPSAEVGTYGYVFTTSLPGVDVGSGNISGDPLFASGPLGDYYLSQPAGGESEESPALNYGMGTVEQFGLVGLTTCSLESGFLDYDPIDLGYHYMLPPAMPRYKLTVSVVDGHGSISVDPASEDGMYYAGTVVKLFASPEYNYRVESWSGGTIDDMSKDPNNLVIMGSDKDIVVKFDQPRLLIVGSQSEYTSIQRAVDAAEDGDIVMIQSGQYFSVEPWDVIDLWGKDITIAGTNSDDPGSVSETVLTGYWFWLTNVGPGTVIEGITLQSGRMHLESSSPIIRNCNFIRNRWRGVDGTAWDGPTDGESGSPSYGGAIRMYDSSPQILGCTFEECSVTGGDGFDGDGGVNGHPYGYDGGWAGRAYGGAVYAAWKSNPVFKGCAFTDCFAQGGNGGNGGDGIDAADGGRGGSWMWADTIESSMYWIWWDGWDMYSMGDKMGPYGWFYWSGWIDFEDEWYQDYITNGLSSVTDPYDAYYDYWKYSGYGGAFYCEVDCSVKFSDCTFTNNNSYGGVCGIGGGPYVEPGPDRPMDIDTAGGAIYISDGCTAEFVDCLIEGNTADTTTVDDDPDLTFFDGPEDYYVSFGGGVGIEKGSDVTFVRCEVQGNNAALGGGIYWVDSEAMIEDCNIVGNLAYHGAGLYSSHSTGGINGTFVTANFASETPPVVTAPEPGADPNSGTGGGGFYHSVLGQGGGYACLSSLVDISDSVFKYNAALTSGGAIYYAGGDQDNYIAPSLFNSLITNNRAGRDGGGISINWYAEPDIANCTISDNIVTGAVGSGFGYGGGIYASYNSRAFITDSIVWGNAGANGAQIAVGSGDMYSPRPSEIKIVYSNIGPPVDPNAVDDLDFIAGDGDTDGSGDAIENLYNSVGQEPVLTDAQAIYDGFDSGEEMVRVIVTLRDFIDMRNATNFESADSAGYLRDTIAEFQESVFATLTSDEFTLSHRYENIAGFAGMVSLDGLDKLLANPSVAFVEPDREVEFMLAQSIPLANAVAARQDYDGSGISVAIIDSGIDYTHPRLGGGGFPNSKVIGGYDFGMNDPDPMPFSVAHGTACAGIAAGDLGTVGDYIGGVAFGARLYALKISADGGGPLTGAAIAAWDWCVTNKYNDPQNPIMVISNSWGIGIPFTDAAMADAFTPGLTNAADVLNKAGITIMAASGNNGFAGLGISHPAAMSKVISVGAVYDTTDTVTPYSNTGNLLDILAPADPMYTTDIMGLGGYDPGDYFPYFNGTSSACPFAAGCVASIQAAALEKVDRFLTPDEMRNLLVSTGMPITDTKVNITKPRVNLGAAIANLVSIPIYVEEGCLLHGWDAESQKWLAETNNIGDDLTIYPRKSKDAKRVYLDDPLFVGDYFLSEIASGQLVTSPAVDYGSGPASSKSGPISKLALDSYTTRTDSVLDDFGNNDPNVNIGYHHPPFDPDQFVLNYFVIVDPFELPGFDPVIVPDIPDGQIYPYGWQVELSVSEPPFGFHAVWNGSDDDFTHQPENVVTMDRDKIVTVSFETIGYTLDAEVIVDANILPNFVADITLDPPGGFEGPAAIAEGIYYPNTEVTLTVTEAPEGMRVKWRGTDDDTVTEVTNTVSMNSDREVIARYVEDAAEYYAVIIGISDYFDFFGTFIEFPYAARDASELSVKLLEDDEHWDEDNIYLLTNNQATKSAIMVVMQELAERLTEKDKLVFYFSGYGYSDVDVEPIDEMDSQDEYLITYNYDGIRDDELGQMLGEFATDNYVVILESDFAAGNIDGIDLSSLGTYDLSAELNFSKAIVSETGFSFSAVDDEPADLQDLNKNDAGVVLAACGVDEIAFYSNDFRHGVFTYNLLRAIEGKGDWLESSDGDGWVSAEEAYDYLAKEVYNYISDMAELGMLPPGTTQSPRIYDADDAADAEIEMLQVEPQDREPKMWYVPGDVDRVQEAVDNAKDGDVIILTAGAYNDGSIIVDKTLTITSTNPDDPDVVAGTVIDLTGTEARFAIYFTANAGPETVINGITFAKAGQRSIIDSTDGFYGGDIISGGLVIGTGASPRVQNCVITGFRIRGGRGGDGDEDDTNFFDGDGGDGGKAYGAGVHCLEESSPTFINTTITDCHVLGGDGGNGAAVNEFNFGAGRGGWGGWARGAGVFIGELAEPLFVNCTISDCTATGGNGGNGGNGGTVDDFPYPPGYGGSWSDEFYYPWDNLGYEGDYTMYSAYGAGIYCSPESKPRFVDCTIEGNMTQGGFSGLGGELGDGALAAGMLVSGGRISPFVVYEIPTFGGGAYCAPDSIVEFEGCTISFNIAPKPGFVLVMDPALGYGGGIVFDGTESAKLSDCVIRGNEASYGGGVYWYDNDLLVEDCNIMDNLAYNGGGIYGLHGDAVIKGGFFHGNYAGATDTDPEQVVGRGGGIHLSSVTADISDLQISGNQASTSGGGLYLVGAELQISNVKNCLFADNISGRDGAGMSANWYSEPAISNCTFVGNWATGYFGFTDPALTPEDEADEIDYSSIGGGLYCGYSTNATVINSIFWDNSAAIGYQVAVGTGFEFDPRPSTLKITYSDVQDGRAESAVFVDEDCTLEWSDNIFADPLFVIGLDGSYYLKQEVTEEPAQMSGYDSPCVDAGSGFASEFGMDKYTTRSDGTFDNGDTDRVDIGFHYELRYESNECRLCDILSDGLINVLDLQELADAWLSQCDAASGWCDGTDINTDEAVDFGDFIVFANCWLVEDTEAPGPNPAEWDIEPAFVGTSLYSVEMSAKLAQDAWWGPRIEYRFDCWIGESDAPDAPDFTSGWQQYYADPSGTTGRYVLDPETFTHSGLVADTQYRYRVKVRDYIGNETAYSEAKSITAGVENNSPLPNPAMWYGDDVAPLGNPDGILDVDANLDGIPDGWPQPMSGTELMMRAHKEAIVSNSDESPFIDGSLEYYFRFTDALGNPIPGNHGHDSGWQQSHDPDKPNYFPEPHIYVDSGLTEYDTYYYRVSVRDRYGNVTEESVVASGTPDSIVVDNIAPLPNPPEWVDPPQQAFLFGMNGWRYYHWMSAQVSADINGVAYEFVCVDNDDLSSGWLNANALLNPSIDPVSGMVIPDNVYYVDVGASGLKYQYYFRVRDLSPRQNTTADSSVMMQLSN